MKALRTHVAGVDVHKDMLAITIMIGGGDEDPKVEHLECSTMTDDLRACGLVLKEKGVRDVAMESTGVYWSAGRSRRKADRSFGAKAQEFGRGYPTRKPSNDYLCAKSESRSVRHFVAVAATKHENCK